MLNIDIVVVTYNSEKWIDNFIASILDSTYDLSKIGLTFIDNNSEDNTVEKLEVFSDLLSSKLDYYQILIQSSNLGFGRANNIGVENSNKDYIFFLNIDTTLEGNTLQVISEQIMKSEGSVAIWECRQFPYEHPKIYNPITLEVSWASAAALVVRRDVYCKVNGFDEQIFMYAEDVDLSWRVRALGYSIKYIPNAVVNHYTYMNVNQLKLNQFYNSTYNNLMLRYKYGNLFEIFVGYLLFLYIFFSRGPSKNHRMIILKNLYKSFSEGKKFRRNSPLIIEQSFKPKFFMWDYEQARVGAYHENSNIHQSSFVSILVRTCGRPDILRETLQTLRNQTYRNFEIIIVEDGANSSQQMINDEFNDLNINYFATKEKKGRCYVGNLALSRASGEYFNFLDDDDLLYADHIEVLLNALQKHPQDKAAYSIAFETPIEVISRNPYKYVEKYYNVVYQERFNRQVLLHHNYFPIQTVLFKKDLYMELGGFDEAFEVAEDWDLWLRYALKYDFRFVNKLTSIYRIPYKNEIAKERQRSLKEYTLRVQQKNPYINEIKTNAESKGITTSIKVHIKQILQQGSLKSSLFIIKRKAINLIRNII